MRGDAEFGDPSKTRVSTTRAILMRRAALVCDADGGRDGKRGGAQQIGISILLVRESLVNSMRRLLSHDRSLVCHVGDGLAHSVGRILYSLRRLTRHRRRLVAYTGRGDAGRVLRVMQAIGCPLGHRRSAVADIRGSVTRDIAYVAQSPRSSLRHGRRRVGNLRCRRACGIPCFGAPILNLVLDDIGQFAGTRRKVPARPRRIGGANGGPRRASPYRARELRAGDVRSRPTTPMPTSSVAIGGRCTRRHAKPAPIAKAATGLAAARSFNSVKRRWAPSLAASLVLATNSSLVSLASAHASSLKRARVLGERRRARSSANRALACSTSRSSAFNSASLIGCPVRAHCSPVKCQGFEPCRVSRRLPRGSGWRRSHLGWGRRWKRMPNSSERWVGCRTCRRPHR